MGGPRLNGYFLSCREVTECPANENVLRSYLAAVNRKLWQHELISDVQFCPRVNRARVEVWAR
jgi:hypothetical protein